MGMMPAHTPPAMSIRTVSGHIEHWYATFKKESQKITLVYTKKNWCRGM